MKIATDLLVFALVFVIVVTAILYTQQRRLLFPAPADDHAAPPSGFRLIHTKTDDGLVLSAFFRPAAPGQRTVLFFHGNGDNLLGAIEATRGPAAKGAALMLVSGFSDLPTVVRSQVPLIPRWLVRDRFDNEKKLASVKAPVFLMHGDADPLVKPDNLARLRTARPDATVVLVAGAGHELVYSAPAQAILAGWVEGLR